MAQRIARVVAFGSLIKGSAPPKRKRLDMGRTPRAEDSKHLAAIRQCPCIVCGRDPAGEAAHIRMTAPDKPNPGMGAKPDDQFSVPLCHACHMKQHTMGELQFWLKAGINALRMAGRLWGLSPNVEKMRAMVLAAIGGAK